MTRGETRPGRSSAAAGIGGSNAEGRGAREGKMSFSPKGGPALRSAGGGQLMTSPSLRNVSCDFGGWGLSKSGCDRMFYSPELLEWTREIGFRPTSLIEVCLLRALDVFDPSLHRILLLIRRDDLKHSSKGVFVPSEGYC